MTQEQFSQQAKQLIEQSGLRPVQLLLEMSDNIYHSLTLVSKPVKTDDTKLDDNDQWGDEWNPYKGHREMARLGYYAICWWFDDELTLQNMRGELIYALPDPGDLGEGVAVLPINCQAWEEIEDINDILDMVGEEHFQAVLDRLTNFRSEDHWNDVIRI